MGFATWWIKLILKSILAEWAAGLYIQLEEFFSWVETNFKNNFIITFGGYNRQSGVSQLLLAICLWSDGVGLMERMSCSGGTVILTFFFFFKCPWTRTSRLYVCQYNLNFLRVSDFVHRRACNLIHKTHNYKSDREVNEQCCASVKDSQGEIC